MFIERVVIENYRCLRNPSGISAFYGAFDLPTCVAELRPSVGGGVISAQFKLMRPICVLDTTLFADRPQAVNLFAAGALIRAKGIMASGARQCRIKGRTHGRTNQQIASPRNCLPTEGRPHTANGDWTPC